MDSCNNFKIIIKNYRCFSIEQPVSIEIRSGYTALIGVNNSGKSTLLKMFYELRDIFTQIGRSNNHLISSLIMENQFNNANTVNDRDELFNNKNEQDILIEFISNYQVEKHQGFLIDSLTIRVPRGKNVFKIEISLMGKKLSIEDAKNIQPNGIEYLTFEGQKYYLGNFVQLFNDLSNMLYIGPFRNAINLSGMNYYDISIGASLINQWDSYKSGPNVKNNEAALKLTEDIRAIFGFNKLEINASNDNHTLKVIVNNKSYSLEELGSGLAQFIIILANVAVKKPSWILIDEPELNLHPSLMLDFLTTLTSYSTKGVIFATHSIGLARSSAERIYSFKIDKDGNSEVKDFESVPKLSEFLGELSFSGYKDLGFDLVLLVEGSSEVKTIQQLLRKYNKEHKVILLSLGGSTTIKADCSTELEEIKRISSNVFALIDSERKSPDDNLEENRLAFVKSCEEAKIECKVLKRRALENYMSDTAIKAIKGDKYHALGEYEKLEAAAFPWAKTENWRIAREMTKEEIENTDLGKFLLSLK